MNGQRCSQHSAEKNNEKLPASVFISLIAGFALTLGCGRVDAESNMVSVFARFGSTEDALYLSCFGRHKTENARFKELVNTRLVNKRFFGV